jgi:hypothetical protein
MPKVPPDRVGGARNSFQALLITASVNIANTAENLGRQRESKAGVFVSQNAMATKIDMIQDQ